MIELYYILAGIIEGEFDELRYKVLDIHDRNILQEVIKARIRQYLLDEDAKQAKKAMLNKIEGSKK